MDGAFTKDIQHWIDIWTDHPGRPATLLEQVRFVWTHAPLQATGLFRLSSYFARQHIPLLPGILRRLTISLYGLDIVSGVEIGGGLYIPHPVGTVIMARRIGRNCTLVSNVTLGMRHDRSFPTIGDNVYIGAGARILGNVSIGDGASIGANAVVLTDVPPGATAVGVPARIIQRADKAAAGGEDTTRAQS